MRRAFSGYYAPSRGHIDKLWREATFAFDANVLLGLYRYSPKTRDLMFKQIEGLVTRVWLPYQAALEYQRGRMKVIRDQQRGYREAETAVDNVLRGLKKELKQFEQRHPYIDPQRITGEFEKTSERVKSSLRKMGTRHPDLARRDSIRSKLDPLFKGKIGETPAGERRAALFADAERRIDLRIPPGYADIGKEGARRLGDAVMWLQLLDQARTHKKPFIFITDDAKQDWWDVDTSPPLPRPELIQEMLDVAGVRFWMYSTTDFLRRSQELERVSSEAETEAAIEEVEEVLTRQRYFVDTSAFEALARAANEQAKMYHQLAALGETLRLPIELGESLRPSLLDLLPEVTVHPSWIARSMAAGVQETEEAPEEQSDAPDADAETKEDGSDTS